MARRTIPTSLRQAAASTRQHNRLVAAVAATTETEAEAVAEEPQGVEAPEAQAERKSFRKERSDRSNKTPITELSVGQQLEGTVVCLG